MDRNLAALVRDASRFIVTFDTAISDSTPHIYLSALACAPPTSFVVKQYKSQFANTLSILGQHGLRWSETINIMRGHTSTVRSIAFSPDGKRMISGSDDGIIHIWDAETGQILLEALLDGNTDGVQSVVFSPGRYVGSLSVLWTKLFALGMMPGLLASFVGSFRRSYSWARRLVDWR